MEIKKDNYFENARNFFLVADQEELVRKLGLQADGDFIYLRVMDIQYRISQKLGDIQRSKDGINYMYEKSHDAALSIFDYLTWSKDDRKLSGEFVSLKGMGFNSHAYLFEGHGGIYERGGAMFSGKSGKLSKVLDRFDGKKMGSADVSSVFEVFDGFPICFQFWEGDDEYTPRIFFLWDANTAQFIHLETTFYLLNMVLDRMAELFEEEIN
ncbi:DUF3786 domain-containing protein [Parasporobacterium paucivorans]|uniref:DUF3786 domain-containing protein n=1 Tax=Parasporobacterium paucivorans DSM 15970 TaxID=1122934 RepID=A0A1M6LEY8_9FIRM|nr:DUF3786 domain-containing protein [Parasporobacterium paucivorans]SHJ69726.1 protein of unknown function [Parasporobacterium paucivorans DSM 15970]